MGSSNRLSVKNQAQAALLLALAPALAFGEGILQVNPNQNNQLQNQQQAKEKNDKGQDLSKLLAILSMALGAMQMAKGMMDQQKCEQAKATQQPPPPGSASPGDSSAPMFIQSALQGRDAIGINGTVTSPTGNACGDGMEQLAKGAQQMLQGLQGMQGANQAGKNSGVSGYNAAKLGALDNKKPQTVSMKSGESQTGVGMKVDPNLLRNGKAEMVMGEFEKKFGINRDDFANAVFNGADPRELLKNAPTNALSADAMNKGFAAAATASPEQKAAAMSELASLQKEAQEQFEIPTGVGAGKTSKKRERDSELAPLDPALLGIQENQGDGSVDGSLSPEVQAALDNAARKDRALGNTDLTIFQVVHSKYKEKFHVLFGTTAGDRSIAGVADKDGN